MSESGDDQGGAGRREVAYRMFAAEFEDADFSYSESDEERAPNYVVTPTGARVNRLFVVGVLTEVEPAGEDILRARVVDPTGAFVVYAGQYQPEAQAFFERADPPAFVAVTGKARTFQPDDSDVVYTSVRPENVNEVTAETRDRWSVQTARQTLDRVATMARALGMDERGDDLRRALEADGVDVGLAAGIPLAIDHYGTTPAYLDAVRGLAVQAAEVVAGDRDEVDPLTADPDAPGDADLAALSTLDVPAGVGGADDAVPGGADEPSASEPATGAGDSSSSGEGDEGQTPDAAAETADEATESPSTTETSGPSSAETDGASAAAEPSDGVSTADADAPTETSDDTAETDVESADDVGDFGSDDDIGDFESSGDVGDVEPEEDGDVSDSDDVGEFDGEFELDEEEREEIEEEYGTGFQTGTEVDDPGEADIDAPEPEPEADEAATAEGSTASVGEPAADEATGSTEQTTDETPEPEPETTDTATETVGSAAGTDEESAAEDEVEDVDLETAVMDAMAENDDGDGASEDAIVEAVTARTGAADDEVRDAIQDCLMGGQCYEPQDGVYKPI